jgi:hypothetical protein
MSRDEVKTIMAALAAAFDPSEVKFKPGAVSGKRPSRTGRCRGSYKRRDMHVDHLVPIRSNRSAHG